MTKTTRRFLTSAGILLGLGVAFLAEEHIRGAIELHAWQRAMRAKGEKLTVAELTPSLTNVAGRVVTSSEAATLLGSAVAPQEYPTPMHLVAPGRARVAWAQTNWLTERLTKPYGVMTNDWSEPGLAGAFKLLHDALPALRSDLTNHAFVVSLDYDLGFDVLLPHLAREKSAMQALCAGTVLALHEHRLDDATADLVAGTALVDELRQEHLLIDQLVRIADAAILQGAVWEALQADGWSDAQLAAIQTGWESPRFLAGMVQAYEMERAIICTYYDSDRYSNRKLLEIVGSVQQINSAFSGSGNGTTDGFLSGLLNAIADGTEKLRTTLHVAVWRIAWVDQDQLFYCQSMQKLIADGRSAAKERRLSPPLLASQSADDDLPFGNPSRTSESGYDRLRYLLSLTTADPSIFQKAAGRAVREETQSQMILAAIAIKRYQLRHGRLPESLTALVPELLREVPHDWFSGGPLHYRPNADGTFLLYSVGEDGKDNSGDPRSTNSVAQPSFYNGRDLVWPMPATPEEVQAAEKREFKRIHR